MTKTYTVVSDPNVKARRVYAYTDGMYARDLGIVQGEQANQEAQIVRLLEEHRVAYKLGDVEWERK